MENQELNKIIEKFDLKNDLTENPDIWIGHAKIGFRNRPSIKEAKKILKEFFNEIIQENQETPEELKKTLKQWENYHPFQHVRELDQPMFIKKGKENIIIAVIWPWQMKKGIASLMLYKGKIIK